MEMVGNARVVIENGKVIEVAEPEIKRCPLFEKARGIKEITPEKIKENMEFRIEKFGLFTPNRLLDDFEDFVGFGASETMMSGLSHGIIDASVSVCDGAGTVITNNPSLVQGMGARMSGLVETSPIPETIQKIKNRNGIVLDEKTAVIDSLAGAKKAAEMNFKKIAVTTTSAETAAAIRNYEKELSGVSFTIIGVHTTGLSRDESKMMAENADIITLCASKCLREVKPLLQVGTSVPLIALTQNGKELLLERAKYVNSTLLVNTMPLPYLPEHKQPK
jgi:putative methanogenesis marker protein 8